MTLLAIQSYKGIKNNDLTSALKSSIHHQMFSLSLHTCRVSLSKTMPTNLTLVHTDITSLKTLLLPKKQRELSSCIPMKSIAKTYSRPSLTSPNTHSSKSSNLRTMCKKIQLTMRVILSYLVREQNPQNRKMLT
jgi:hypothetical protein